MGENAAPLRFSETMDATSAELVRVAKDFGFEGIVAKRADSFYESGKRSGAWLKYRINKGQEFVIGGYSRRRRNQISSFTDLVDKSTGA
jgi:bifunctional non-homologous end joining protein LigD